MNASLLGKNPITAELPNARTFLKAVQWHCANWSSDRAITMAMATKFLVMLLKRSSRHTRVSTRGFSVGTKSVEHWDRLVENRSSPENLEEPGMIRGRWEALTFCTSQRKEVYKVQMTALAQEVESSEFDPSEDYFAGETLVLNIVWPLLDTGCHPTRIAERWMISHEAIKKVGVRFPEPIRIAGNNILKGAQLPELFPISFS